MTPTLSILCLDKKLLNTLDDKDIMFRDINYQYYYDAACKIIDPIKLQKMIEKTAFSASTQETRYILNGLLWNNTADKFEIDAEYEVSHHFSY